MRRRDEHNKEKQRKNFHNRLDARELPQLQPGDRLWLPVKEVEGTTREVQSFNILSENEFYQRFQRDIIHLPDPPAPLKKWHRTHGHPMHLLNCYEGAHVIPGD